LCQISETLSSHLRDFQSFVALSHATARLSHSLGVRPPVCLSVCHTLLVSTNHRGITRFSPSGSPGTLVFSTNFYTLLPGKLPWESFKRDGWVITAKNAYFRTINFSISETIKDRHVSTTEN